MTAYLVRWIINVDADSEEKAAEKAREIQLDPTSTATIFDVTPCSPDGGFYIQNCKSIDLQVDLEDACVH